MIVSQSAILSRARALVGVPFRPQGRDPKFGLDCVGLVLKVFDIADEEAPRTYRLRGKHAADVKAAMKRRFVRVGPKRRRSGDVLLALVARDQIHLAIHCGASFVHADARLRRVVETPGEPHWPVVAVFRRRSRRQSS